MEKNLCKAYLESAENDKAYYEIFFQMCQKFHVDWASASEKEKNFIEEVTRVTYEKSCLERDGSTQTKIHPAFTA